MSVTGLQTEGLKYAKAIFDTVRRMSADTLGVSRQGYSELETDVLHYLQGLGRDIGLEVRADDAGNVWIRCPAATARFPPSLPAAMLTAFRRAATTTAWPA